MLIGSYGTCQNVRSRSRLEFWSTPIWLYHNKRNANTPKHCLINQNNNAFKFLGLGDTPISISSVGYVQKLYIYIYIHSFIYLFVSCVYLLNKYVCIYLLIYLFIVDIYIYICLYMYTQNPDIFDVRSYIWWFLHWDSHSDLLTLLLEGRQLPESSGAGIMGIQALTTVRLPIFHIYCIPSEKIIICIPMMAHDMGMGQNLVPL